MSFMKAVFTQGEQLLESANRWHQTVVLWTVVGVIFAITTGVLANVAGFPGFNFILAAVTLLTGIFFLTKPAIVLSVFGLGSFVKGLPNLKTGELLGISGSIKIPDFELEKFLGAGWNVVKATAHKVAHAFFLTTVFFVVLGTFPISDPALVLPAIVILTGVGLWAALFTKETVWYKRITIVILLVVLAGVLWKTYTRPSETDAALDKKERTEKSVRDESDAAFVKRFNLTDANLATPDGRRYRQIIAQANRPLLDKVDDVARDIIGVGSVTRTVEIEWGKPFVIDGRELWSKPVLVKVPVGRRTFRVKYPVRVYCLLKEGERQVIVINEDDGTGFDVVAGSVHHGDDFESSGYINVWFKYPITFPEYIRKNIKTTFPVIATITVE